MICSYFITFILIQRKIYDNYLINRRAWSFCYTKLTASNNKYHENNIFTYIFYIYNIIRKSSIHEPYVTRIYINKD